MSSQTETELRLGGRYRIEEPIGYGSMGHVFRAIDELLDRPVAIKLLDQPGRDMPEIAEARAAARLSHPGVVHVFDVGVSESEGQGYIVMELVPGRSLREILRERRLLSRDEAAELAAQLADALDTIHRLDMVHCDVKPLNIIVTPSGHAKLIDFGIARASTAAAGDPLGSAAYVAPEQARGEPVDGRADIYALGAVLYEMLVGSRPFEGSDTADLVRRRLETDPPAPRSVDPRVPRELDAIVLRALAREPAQRYATAAEMRDALRTFIAHAAEPTQPIQASHPIQPLEPMAPQRASQARSAPRSSLSPGPGPSPSSTPRPSASAASHPSHPQGAAADARRSFVVSSRSPVVNFVYVPRLAVGIATVVLIGWLVVAGWRVTRPTGNGVPHLVGLRLSEVPTALEEAGIAPADVTVLTREVEPRYAGTVVDQQPQPGQRRQADSDIQIAIGVGP